MIIAPIMLVAAKPTIRSTAAVNIVPNIPASKADIAEHIHLVLFSVFTKGVVIRAIARNKIATPSAVIKITGVIVIVAVIVRNAVIMPIIMLATIATPVQLNLQLQFKLHILNSPPIIVYAKAFLVVNSYMCRYAFKGLQFQKNMVSLYKSLKRGAIYYDT